MQHILKHLRQRRLLTPFNSILTQSSVRLEHPLITELYESVVLTGNWDKAENVLHDMSAAGLFDQCLKSSDPRAVWREIHATDANGDIPSVRGGHAMCIDTQRRYIVSDLNIVQVRSVKPQRSTPELLVPFRGMGWPDKLGRFLAL